MGGGGDRSQAQGKQMGVGAGLTFLESQSWEGGGCFWVRESGSQDDI